MHSKAHLWVVILAAGEGKRVMGLTHDRWGLPAPKQYSSIDGRSTLLGATLERAKKITSPERIVVVVARQHNQWWTSELADLPAQNVIVQPENRGTAAGILLPLLWVTKYDPNAHLVILPSDHGVASEETLHNAITEAVAFAPRPDSEMVLLGVQPEGPEIDYGWVVPRPGSNGSLRPVGSFREKPDAATAAALLNQGGLLNSFILIAGGRYLLDLYETALPQLWRAFQPVINETRIGTVTDQSVAQLYSSVPTLDFSKDLLEGAADQLWVYPVPACGWLDLGTPKRLTAHLVTHGQQSWDGPFPTTNREPLQVPQTPPRDLDVTKSCGATTANASA